MIEINTLHSEKNKPSYMLFLVFFFNGLGINSFNTTDVSLVLISLLGLLYLVFIKKTKIDNIFFYVVLYWTLVNVFSFVILGGTFNYLTFVGSILKLFIGYCYIKIFGQYFIPMFQKTVLALALLSIPLYLLQLNDNNIFYNIPFNFTEKTRQSIGEWNGLVFNYSPIAHSNKNSGFAGEPGTFGYYIGLAMIFNLILNDGKVNKNFFILLMIGLTTFSTNYYLSLLLFCLFFIIRSTSKVRLVSLFLFIPLIFFVYNFPFVGLKIQDFIDQSVVINNLNNTRLSRINRFATFLNHFESVLKYPFGYGINKHSLKTNLYGLEIGGTNDISRIAIKYGVFGFIFFLTVYFKLFQIISVNLKGNAVFALITFMYIAANSMERDYFAMGLFWLYFVIKSDYTLTMNNHFTFSNRLT